MQSKNKLCCEGIKINFDEFKKVYSELIVLYTNNSLNNISLSTNVDDCDEKIQSIITILEVVCPNKFKSVCNIFNINLESEIFDIYNDIFRCINIEIINATDLIDSKYHNISEFKKNENNKTFTYFNSVIPKESRIVTNKNKKGVDSSATISLKIKNDDLENDLLAINILVKLPENNELFLNVRAITINDSHNVIKNTDKFIKCFNNHNNIKSNKDLYDIAHLRDCCLNSFNGQNSFEYIKNVWNFIGTCDTVCSNNMSNPDTDANNSNNDCCHETIAFIDNMKKNKYSSCGDNVCTESAHFIRKFAKYCFHTKYLISVYTAKNQRQLCLFLAIILVKCNNRLCREFLNALPNEYKCLILDSGHILGHEENKNNITINENETLVDKVMFWKEYALKYGLNIKKLIDKCNELLPLDEDKGNGLFGGSDNGDKERSKKMLKYIKEIGSDFFLLNIHHELINLINNTKIPNKKINSINDIYNCIFDPNNNNNQNMIKIKTNVKNYNNSILKFRNHVEKIIVNMSEGQNTVKLELFKYIMDIVTNPKPLASRKILCLVGPPGVGKTFISLAIAKILFFNENENPSDDDVKKLVHIISVPGINDENTLLGSNSVYVGSKPGILTKELLFNKQLCRKLIIFDEIDKSSKCTEQFIPILDYTQNDKITDNYFDIELDMRMSMIVATANDASNIHPILRDRLHIINVSGYNTHTKIKMVQDYIAPKLLEERSLPPDLIYFPEDVLEKIIQTKTCEAGVRKLKNLILDCITNIKLGLKFDDNDNEDNNDMKDDIAFYMYQSDFKDMNDDNKYYSYTNRNINEFHKKINERFKKYYKLRARGSTNPQIVITLDDINIILNTREHRIDSINDIKKWESGKVIGLYATTMGIGGILPISIKLNKSLTDKGLLITLGAKETMKESATISTMLVSDYLQHMYNEDDDTFKNYFGICKNDFGTKVTDIVNNSAPHIILDSSTPKDGPSAGGAFMVAYLSKILGKTLSNKVGITGEISSNFTITAIGGLNMKINGAMQGGLRSVIIPKENTNDFINELVYENSIDVKDEPCKRIAFIYYCDKEKNYVILIRTAPSINSKLNLNKSSSENRSLNVNVDVGNSSFLNMSEDNKNTVPVLYKIILKKLKLITPDDLSKIDLVDGITLKYIMNSYFTVLALENIDEIFHYMISAKNVFNPDWHTIDTIEEQLYDGNEKLKKNKLN